MKKLIFIFALLAFTCCLTNNAEAKGIPIPVNFGGEKISTILDLPNDSTFMTEDGHYVNVGCIYKQFSILWIPMWNWDEKYCITYEDMPDKYMSITKEELEEELKASNLTLPSAHPSFWNRIGGKMIWILVLGGIIWGYIPSKKTKE